jgi:hypothetical protein
MIMGQSQNNVESMAKKPLWDKKEYWVESSSEDGSEKER